MAGSELESVWGAMKGVRYRRIISKRAGKRYP